MGTPQPKKNADKKRDGKKWKNSRPAPMGKPRYSTCPMMPPPPEPTPKRHDTPKKL